MIKAKEIEKANDEFHQPFLHIKKKARQIQENYLNFTKLFTTTNTKCHFKMVKCESYFH